MANKKQLALLKNDVKAWNEWREKNPGVKIDLLKANLKKAILCGANLCEANLYEANLSKANLRLADLRRAYLSEANLRDADLRQANLARVDLIGADLSGANLSEANLINANLHEAKFCTANLDGAILDMANLDAANFSETNLCETYLRRAILSKTILIGADLRGAVVGETQIVNLDLSQVNGLEGIEYSAPSSIGIDTIYKSKGNIPEVFLRGCGVPEDMIAYARSIRGKVIDFYSCFISHSAKDKPFCERLYADLQAKGVRTWYFPEDAKWGETVWGEIDRGIKIYDKLVIVLSEHSLNSKPVLREIQRSLNREDKEHKNILFLIAMDHYVFEQWEHERKADVMEKVIGDFVGWDKDVDKYRKAFEKLLKGLQAG